MMKRVLLAMTLSTSCAMLSAQAETVQELLEVCQWPNNGGACFGYLAGVDEAADGLCVPSVTRAALRQVFLNWAERNPQKWGDPAAIGVWLSIKEAWPCDTSKPQ